MGSLWFAGARRGWRLGRRDWFRVQQRLCRGRLGLSLERLGWCQEQQELCLVRQGSCLVRQGLWQLTEHRSYSSSLADLALGPDLGNVLAINGR